MNDEELDAEHEARITLECQKLHDGLSAALEGLEKALQASNALTYGNARHIEYDGGGEFHDHLKEARRLAIIAHAIVPTDNTGEATDDGVLGEAVKALMNGSHLK